MLREILLPIVDLLIPVFGLLAIFVALALAATVLFKDDDR